jgi:hypothetical protein
VVTNTVLATNIVEQIVERTNVVLVTDLTAGAVSGYAVREPVATNYLTLAQTNLVPVFFTNLVQVPVTNLVGKIEAEAGFNAAGATLNMFLPGIGSIVAMRPRRALPRLPPGAKPQGERSADSRS